MRPESPRAADGVVLTGWSVLTAAGRGTAALWDAVLTGRSMFGPVTRFSVEGRRATEAAVAADVVDLVTELEWATRSACADAGLDERERAECAMLLAASMDSGLARGSVVDGAGATAAKLADACGLAGAVRAYTTGCVAASSALADAARLVADGVWPRVLVVAGFLVDADHFGVFDAGRALAEDNVLRPFGKGRKGTMLGDGVGAVLLEGETAARRRGAVPYARLAGWARAGEAFHVCQPHPDGDGVVSVLEAVIRGTGVTVDRIGYVNANGTGTVQSDAAEATAFHRVFGSAVRRLPVSSTKSVHGHSLEASALVELITTALAMRHGRLPVNAGVEEPDEACRLDLVLERARPAEPQYALSVNAAFGGATTALLLGAA